VSAPTIEVGVALGVAEDGDFIIGDATRGRIGSTTYLISSGYTTVTADSYAVSITRGRWSRLWDSVDAGSANVQLHNMDRSFDPSYLASPYSGYIVPGRGTQITANGVTIWTGFVDDWNLEYDRSGQSTATVASTDALGMLGQLQFDAWTSSGIAAGTKLHAVCDRSEVAWSSALRDFEEGVETLAADAVSHGANVLSYGQLIARSELGYLFASADGLLTYRNRNVAVGATSAVSFGGEGEVLTDEFGEVLTDDFGDPLTTGDAGIAYRELSATIGSELLFARVSVDREGGTAQSATVADVDAWTNLYGPQRSNAIAGLLLDDDSQSLALAEYLLSLYDTPRYRISELTVELAGLDTDDQDAVLALDITSVVDVSFTPNGVGDPILQTLVVQGIRHDISTSTHTVTLSLIDAPFPFFRIGDSEYGVIGDDVIGF
jgi:hypothetical protein